MGIRGSCWTSPDEATNACQRLQSALDDARTLGAVGLLVEIARLDAAAELGCLSDYVAGRRSRAELVWSDIAVADSSTTGTPTGVDAGPALGDFDDTFKVGK